MDEATKIVESIKNITLGGGAPPAESKPVESKPRGEKKAKKAAAKAPVDGTPLEVTQPTAILELCYKFQRIFWLILA